MRSPNQVWLLQFEVQFQLTTKKRREFQEEFLELSESI
jgi:hypothetical protein